MPQARPMIPSYLFLTCSVCLICLSCEIRPVPATVYPDRSFNSLAWRNDTTGCQYYRTRTYEAVMQNKGFFLGKPYAVLEQLLGPPNSLLLGKGGDNSFASYVVDCPAASFPKAALILTPSDPSIVKDFLLSESTQLAIYVKQDTCREMYIRLPHAEIANVY